MDHSDRAYVPENRPKHHQTSALLACAGKVKKHRRRVLEEGWKGSWRGGRGVGGM